MIELNISEYHYLLREWPFLASAMAFGYLLGSIPFGLLLARSAGLGDIRQTGSGNIGATNVLRTGNKKLAALTLLLDMTKASVAVAVVSYLMQPVINAEFRILPNPAAYAAGLGALLGHIFPVWLSGKGGKGVACYFGILLALNWQVFVITALNWVMVFIARKISSLSALFAAVFVPFWLLVFTDQLGMLFGILASLLIIGKHHENVARLLQGTEKPFKSNDKTANKTHDHSCCAHDHHHDHSEKEHPSA